MRRFTRSNLFAPLLAMACLQASYGLAGDVLHGVYVPNCVCKRCCDDYCPKPMPRACGVKSFCCDDYCRKSEPCPAYVTRFCCDDYVPKCQPRVFCPPGNNLKCPPRPSQCAAGTASAVPTIQPAVTK